MIQRAVKAIRAFYRADVPIIVRMDAGFMDHTKNHGVRFCFMINS
jgi:hypothetical protein